MMFANLVVQSYLNEPILNEENNSRIILNRKTIAAMEAARRGDLMTVENIDKLLISLNEDD